MIQYLFAGFAIGSVIAWLIAKLSVKNKSVPKAEFEAQVTKLNQLATELGIEKERSRGLSINLSGKEQDLKSVAAKNTELTGLLAKANANLEAINHSGKMQEEDKKQLQADLKIKTGEVNLAIGQVADLKAKNEAFQEKLQTQKAEIEELKKQFNTEFENIANKILDEKTAKFH